jgi:hypothetical protein
MITVEGIAGTGKTRLAQLIFAALSDDVVWQDATVVLEDGAETASKPSAFSNPGATLLVRTLERVPAHRVFCTLPRTPDAP